MVQGKELTEQEKEFIHAKKATTFSSEIADQLGEKFGLVNGGLRSAKTVKNFLKRESD